VLSGKINSVLHNFLGTYTSRYSDYEGFWLFGFLVDSLDVLEIDLLHIEGKTLEFTPLSFAIKLAVAKFSEQIVKSGISVSDIYEANLNIIKSPVIMRGPVNGHICTGNDLCFTVKATSRLGKKYERATSIFVAPHSPLLEIRRNREFNRI
jgi:hypothetical protein